MTIKDKNNSLRGILKKLGKVILAYSGGVDSTFLLKVCVDVLGVENVHPFLAVSPPLSEYQKKHALMVAKTIGVEVKEIELNEIRDTNYASNKADRCFHCKAHLYGALQKAGRELDIENIICGSNLDDMGDYRPGNRAAEVFGVRAPLLEAQLTKKDIRALSRKLGLSTADVPASPCLASRIAYGTEITVERLEQVEKAEDFLRELGFVEFRVRHHGDTARVEVKGNNIEKLATEKVRTAVANKLKSLGFKFAAMDLEGFRSGALNVVLSKETKSQEGG